MLPCSSYVPSTPRRSAKSSKSHLTISPYFTQARLGVSTASPSELLCSSSLQSSSSPEPCTPTIKRRSKKGVENPSTPRNKLKPSPPLQTDTLFIHDATYAHFGVDPQLLKDPLYAFQIRKFTRLLAAIWCARPILIQESVCQDPWKLLIAVMLLNKTAGTNAIPAFWDIMSRWPTPEALSRADPSEVKPLIASLGLQEKRSKRLIALSAAYLTDPPRLDCLRATKAYHVPVKNELTGKPTTTSLKKTKYPPTPISHLPGCGPYALDSYRIFCMPGDEWKSVMPADKELIKYLRWKWALFERRRWDPILGALEQLDEDSLSAFPEQLLTS